MSNEGLVLDNLTLNDENPWRILDGTFQFTPARKKLNWASSALADGAALIGDEDHYENAEMVFRLRMEAQDSPDTSFALLNTLTEKLQSARGVRGGLPLTWTPANSNNTLTLYVLDTEYDELPMSYEEGWTTQAFQLVVHLYLRPFLYGFEQQLGLGISDAFAYDSITNGGWRIETGTGTVAVSGGNLTVSSTVAKRLYRSPLITDSVVTTRFRTGTSTTGTSGVILKHLATGTAGNLDRVWAWVNGATPGVLIQKQSISGGSGILATGSAPALATSTWYWLQAGITGNDITASLYADAQDPLNNPAPVPITTVSYTLSGADATQFGDGVRGQPGIITTPSDNSWLIDQYTLSDTPDIFSGEPIFGFEIPQVEGHVAAEGRLVVAEANVFGGQDRSHFEWGLESRNYDQTAVWPLLIDSDAMTSGGFAGAQSTRTGAYDPNATGNNVITADDISETVPLTVCSFGSQSHIGVFKVKVRVFGTEGIRCRLTWRIGDGQAARNDYSIPLSGVDWQEVDLGTINIPEAAIGDQAWTGRIEAVGVSGGSVTIDYAEIIPVERYGVARAPLRPITPTVYAAFDNFNQGTQASLNAKTLDSGQTWTTSGAATGDYSIVAAPAEVHRVAVSDTNVNTGRYALAGTANFAGVQVQADVGVSTAISRGFDLTDDLRMGIVLRYIDANNWLTVVRQTVSTQVLAGISFWNHNTFLRIYKRVAGTVTQLGSYNEGTTPDIHRTVICQVDAAGVYQVYSFHPGTQQPAEPQIVGQDTVLATSGTLSDGKIGLYDAYGLATPAVTRTYDNFVAFDSQAQVVMYAGKHLEVRADRTERESGSVNQYGKVPMYRGDRFFLPKAEGPSRVATKARRNDVDGGLPDNAIGDFILVSVFATPRFLVPS